MKRWWAKSSSELTPLPKSAAAATRCSGVGSSPGTTGTARRTHTVAGPRRSKCPVTYSSSAPALWKAR